ncbi:hypothetical protein B296_00009697 [Ensete ventricosum]|uniref:Uncharacterized protein n=1 Tax=Ensete ventricosum TaxID=4639 RepID=A0A426YAK2_ENSVE|nr:hypothetical protein B296_00009697 [Ensete ventricosum]
MRLGTRLQCIRSSPRVLGVYQNGAKELVKKRLRLIGRLSGVVERLVESLGRSYRPDIDPGSSLGIEPRFRRCGGSSPGVHLNFTEGIGKIARNTLGDRWRRTVRLVIRNTESCQIVGVRSLSLMVTYGCNP